MSIIPMKYPARTDCRYYNAELKCCTVLTELYCRKKHHCGFHQDEEAKRLPKIRAKAHDQLEARKEKLK